MIPYLPVRRIAPASLHDIGPFFPAQRGRFPSHPGNMPLNKHSGASLAPEEIKRRKGFQVEAVYADQVQMGIIDE